MRDVLRWNPDTGEFKRSVVPERKPPMMTETQKKKEAARKSAMIQQYMRDEHITEGEAATMYAEFGIHAPKRKYRR